MSRTFGKGNVAERMEVDEERAESPLLLTQEGEHFLFGAEAAPKGLFQEGFLGGEEAVAVGTMASGQREQHHKCRDRQGFVAAMSAAFRIMEEFAEDFPLCETIRTFAAQSYINGTITYQRTKVMAKIGYMLLAPGYDDAEADAKWMADFGCVEIIRETPAGGSSPSSVFRILNAAGISLDRGHTRGPRKKKGE